MDALAIDTNLDPNITPASADDSPTSLRQRPIRFPDPYDLLRSRSDYCHICGDEIDGPFYGHRDPSWSWKACVRIVRTDDGSIESIANAYVTGVGFKTSIGSVLAPHDVSVTWCPWSSPPARQIGWPGELVGYYAFTIHNACWQTLRFEITRSLGAVDPSRIAPQLLKVFISRSTPSLFDDYQYGLYPFYGLIPRRDTRTPSDPASIEELPPVPELPEPWPIARRTAEQAARDFPFLPPELWVDIFCYISSCDVANLRLASRRVAEVARPDRLGETFWRNRFGPDQTFEFALGLFDPDVRDHKWRARFEHVRATFRQKNLDNRRHLWASIRDILQALVTLIQHDSGHAFGSRDHRDVTDGSVESAVVDPFFASPRLERGGRLPPRLFASERLLFSPSSLGAVRVRVEISTLEFEKRAYICGVRVSAMSSPETDYVEVSRAGLHLPHSSTALMIERTQFISKVRVCGVRQGVVGLEFELNDRDGGSRTETFGTTRNIPPGFGIYTAGTALKDMEISGLRVGFDAIRMVSIRTLERTQSGQQPAWERAEAVRAWMWHPEEPDTETKLSLARLFQDSGLSRGQKTYLAQVVDFDSSELTGVSAIYGPDPKKTHLRLRFHYADGSSQYLGCFKTPAASPALEFGRLHRQGFYVNGAAGEGIVKIVLQMGWKDPELEGNGSFVHITTNFGRCGLLSNALEIDPDREGFKRVFEARPGEFLSRGVALLKGRRPLVIDFHGAPRSGHHPGTDSGPRRSIGRLPPRGHHLPADAALSIPPHMWSIVSAKYNLHHVTGYGFVGTAGLDKVRSVTVFGGKGELQGMVLMPDLRGTVHMPDPPYMTDGISPRGQDHISGLALHYEDGGSACLGQHLHTVGHIRLDRGERIVGASFGVEAVCGTETLFHRITRFRSVTLTIRSRNGTKRQKRISADHREKTDPVRWVLPARRAGKGLLGLTWLVGFETNSDAVLGVYPRAAKGDRDAEYDLYCNRDVRM